jgi:hypothetical protein
MTIDLTVACMRGIPLLTRVKLAVALANVGEYPMTVARALHDDCTAEQWRQFVGCVCVVQDAAGDTSEEARDGIRLLEASRADSAGA